MSLYTFIVHELEHNQFLTAALVAGPMAALTYTARSLPWRLWGLVKRSFCVTVGFNSDIPDYLAVQEFVAEQIVSDRFSRSYLYTSESRWDHESSDTTVVHRGLTPGYGPHFGWWKGRPVWIDRSQLEASATERFKERLSLTFLTRSREMVRAFAQEVRAYGQKAVDRDSISLFVNSGGWWRFASKLPKRSLATVFTPNAEAAALVSHLRTFEERREWYRRRGLPYHTGILLTGKPGTGKSSLIHAVASEVERSLHYLNLGSVENDQQLTDLVSTGRNWSRSILVVEDADASGAHVTRSAPPAVQAAGSAAPSNPSDAPAEPRKPLTLSALLNVLDGLLTPDGLIVIATSNHPERLDPALIRPGRFDLHLEIGDLDWPAFVAMARLFEFALEDSDPRRFLYVPSPGATVRAKLLEGGLEAVLRSEAAAA